MFSANIERVGIAIRPMLRAKQSPLAEETPMRSPV